VKPLAGLLLLALATPASAATLEVGAGAPFGSIAAAIAAARDGDAVVVHAGVYREHVVVDRAIELRGEPGALIDGEGRGTVVLVAHGGAAVRGFAIRGTGESLLDEDAGVKLRDAPGGCVEGNRIEDALFGVLVRTCAGVRVAGNFVRGKDLEIPRRADGIRLQDAAGSEVDDNVVEDARDLAIWNSNGCSARRNTVRRCRYGLHFMYCDDDVFEDNVFEGNQTGGAIMYSRRLTLRRNRFAGSRGPAAHGLLLKDADDVIAEGNWFVDNTRGLFIEETTTSRHAFCKIRENVIGGNEIGIALQPSAARIVFSGNVLVANRVQVEALGWAKADQNAWSADGRGNYWSDYVGFDADGDGIGDTPQRVEQFFERLTDRWPAVGLLRMGPAAEALEAAARAFPVVAPKPAATDEHPLMAPPATVGAPPAARSRPLLAGAGALAAIAAGLVLHRARQGGDAS
jgi:nitrous oxidase accessory protein